MQRGNAKLGVVTALLLIAVVGWMWMDDEGPAPVDEPPGFGDPAAVVPAGDTPTPGQPVLEGAPGRPHPAPGDADEAKDGTAGSASDGDAALAGTEPAAERALSVFGRVVDESRKPVEGALVRLRSTSTTWVGVRTDKAGRFRVRAERPEYDQWVRALLVARTDDGRIATRDHFLAQSAPDETDAGALALKPGHTLRLKVTANAAESLPATVDVFRDGLQGGASVLRRKTDEQGVVELKGLPEGPIRIIAWAVGHGRGVARTTLPRDDDTPLLVSLGAGRPVTVTVVKASDASPIPGAQIVLWESVGGPGWHGSLEYAPQRTIPPTDVNGITTISDLDTEATVEALVRIGTRWALGGLGNMVSNDARKITPQDNELRIEVPDPRTVTFPLTDKEGPIPPDGTTLAIRPRRGAVQTQLPAQARIENGAVVVEDLVGGHPFHAEVLTTDGHIASLFAMPEATEGHETSFRKATTVVVRLKHPDGTPVVGRHVLIRNRGNNPLHAPIPTDDAGIARIEGLLGRRAVVFLTSAGQNHGGRAVGNIDLSKGDVELDVEVGLTRRAILTVFIDGAPGLPAQYSLSMPSFMGQTAIKAEEVPHKGELHFDWTTPKGGAKQMLNLSATGYTRAEPTYLAAGDGDAPDRAEVHLTSGGSLTVRIRLPKDKHIQIVAQRWDAGSKSWKLHWGGMSLPDPEGKAVFHSLPEGRFRILETSAGIASEPVDVKPNTMSEVAIDASGAAQCKGRIEVPRGFQAGEVRVHVRGNEPYVHLGRGAAQGAMVRPNGDFWVRLPGDREVTLDPVHATLVPAPEGGRIRLTTARDGIVLRMVKGATATIRTTPAPPKVRVRRGQAPGFAAKFFRGPPSGKPVHETRALDEAGVLRLGGYAPGTYTIWIDIPPYAPLILKDVKLPAKDVDLGEHPLSKGTTIRVTVLKKKDTDKPRIFVTASCTTEPKYVRYVNSNGESVVELTGLGPGRFDLAIGGGLSTAGGPPKREPIEVDGNGVVERELDLR